MPVLGCRTPGGQGRWAGGRGGSIITLLQTRTWVYMGALHLGQEAAPVRMLLDSRLHTVLGGLYPTARFVYEDRADTQPAGAGPFSEGKPGLADLPGEERC